MLYIASYVIIPPNSPGLHGTLHIFTRVLELLGQRLLQLIHRQSQDSFFLGSGHIAQPTGGHLVPAACEVCIVYGEGRIYNLYWWRGWGSVLERGGGRCDCTRG